MIFLNFTHVKYDFFTVFFITEWRWKKAQKIWSKIRFGIFLKNWAKIFYIGRKNFILVYLYFTAICIILNVIEFYKFPLQ